MKQNPHIHTHTHVNRSTLVVSLCTGGRRRWWRGKNGTKLAVGPPVSRTEVAEESAMCVCVCTMRGCFGLWLSLRLFWVWVEAKTSTVEAACRELKEVGKNVLGEDKSYVVYVRRVMQIILVKVRKKVKKAGCTKSRKKGGGKDENHCQMFYFKKLRELVHTLLGHQNL